MGLCPEVNQREDINQNNYFKLCKKMKIFRSLYTNWKTQGYGLENTKPEMLPLYQSLGLFGHNGWDWAAGDGQKIHWDCDIEGEVLNTSTDAKGGLGVEVLTKDIDGMFIHRFWHLKSFACQAGQKLGSGDLIGLADSTGWSTGPHLHRDLKRVERDQFGNYKTLNGDNGYFGCIDPTPYFENIFVVDKMEHSKKQVEMLTEQVSIWKKLIELWKKLKFPLIL